MDKIVLATEIMDWWEAHQTNTHKMYQVPKPKFVSMAEEILKERESIVMKS